MAATIKFDRLYDLSALADAINYLTFDEEIKILHDYFFRFNDADVEVYGYIHGTFDRTDATLDTPPWVDLVSVLPEIYEVVVYKYEYSYELTPEQINELEELIK